MYKIIANWKMYLTIEQSRLLAAKLVQWWEEIDCPQVSFVVCPSMLAVNDVMVQVDYSSIDVGVQGISISPEPGAFTGQASAQQIKEAHASYVIIGHSEMRKYDHITDEIIAKQLYTIWKHDLIPIICVGETKDERDQGRADQVVSSQIHTIFSSKTIPESEFYIAYEPRWAIGTGKPVDPKEAERIHQLIRHIMLEFDENITDKLHILYGGSVDAENIQSFLDQQNVDGALIGSASAKADSLHAIIKTLNTTVCHY